jgi:glycosyltransferase involved in cell wall biosynthesis
MPRISIGLPVYNGENFLEQTLDSILSQTYKDFELIISDNASTDKTEKICNLYAEKDKRIRYSRNKENLGGAKNYNKVFELSKGEYFKWAAHDDLILPTFLERCVEVLDRDSSIVLCYSKFKFIDKDGHSIEKNYIYRLNHSSSKPVKRYHDFVLIGNMTFEHFGLVRSEILKKTLLYEPHTFSDCVLLAELSLLGKFYEIPETLFHIRLHPDISTVRFPDRVTATLWFDPSKEGKLAYPNWRAIERYTEIVNRTPMKYNEKISCYLIIGNWIIDNNHHLRSDVKIAIKKTIMKIKYRCGHRRSNDLKIGNKE